MYEAQRRWREKNREKVRAIHRAQYARAPERHLATAKEWHAANRERVRHTQEKYRENERLWAPPRRRTKKPREPRLDQRSRFGRVALRLEIAERDRWVCQLCRRKVKPQLVWPDPWSATLDHIVPAKLGGSGARANLQLAHAVCNQSKHIRAMGEQLRLL